jgi:probable HAF family extracellular repeat protein
MPLRRHLAALGLTVLPVMACETIEEPLSVAAETPPSTFMTSTGVPVTDLGFGAAHGINAQAQVVGRREVDGMSRAWLWDLRSGETVDIGTLDDGDAQAFDISNRGQVVGGGLPFSGTGTAFLWEDDQMIDLGPRQARAINARGWVTGFDPAWLWVDGERTYIGTLGGTLCLAFGMNERGYIVGQSEHEPGSPDRHAFLWKEGEMIDLGTIAGDANSRAYDINQPGQIVGTSYGADGVDQACLWENGQIIDLGTLGGGESRAVAINNRGQVVGWSRTPSGETHAFLWENGTMIDLGTLAGHDQSRARAISESGMIAGSSLSLGTEGSSRAVVWNVH